MRQAIVDLRGDDLLCADGEAPDATLGGMTMTIYGKAAVLDRPNGAFTVEEYRVPELGPGETGGIVRPPHGLQKQQVDEAIVKPCGMDCIQLFEMALKLRDRQILLVQIEQHAQGHHLAGGFLDIFSKSPARRMAYDCITCFNTRHQLFAWCSLVGVMFADFYVYMCSLGVFRDLRIL